VWRLALVQTNNKAVCFVSVLSLDRFDLSQLSFI
jgi:hypothetical protein